MNDSEFNTTLICVIGSLAAWWSLLLELATRLAPPTLS